jgi:tetratricopeptide (TPR) repeat protein
MEMFANRRVPADHPAMESVYRNFRENLRDILRLADRAKVPVVLCTIAVNLTDYAPLAGTEAKNAWSEAVEAQSAGNRAAARSAFLRARDLDELRFRADGVINAIIREEAAAASGSVILVDIEKGFAALPDDRGDSALFWEHVHLTPQGNDLVARFVFAALEPLLSGRFGTNARQLASATDLLRGLGWTPAEEVYAIDDMLLLVGREPFASQAGAPERRNRLVARREEQRALWERADKHAHATAMRTELERHPHDPWQRVALAQALANIGDIEGELAEKRCIVGCFPLDVTSLLNLGNVETGSGNLAAAASAFARALEVNPRASAPVLGLATVAMRKGESERAIKTIERGLEGDNTQVDLLVALAQIHRFEGRPEQAAEIARRVLLLDPHNEAALAELQELKQHHGVKN